MTKEATSDEKLELRKWFRVRMRKDQPPDDLYVKRKHMRHPTLDTLKSSDRNVPYLVQLRKG